MDIPGLKRNKVLFLSPLTKKILRNSSSFFLQNEVSLPQIRSVVSTIRLFYSPASTIQQKYASAIPKLSPILGPFY